MNTILARVNTAEEERSVSSRYRVSPYRPRILTARVSLGQSEAWSGQAAGGTESEGAELLTTGAPA